MSDIAQQHTTIVYYPPELKSEIQENIEHLCLGKLSTKYRVETRYLHQINPAHAFDKQQSIESNLLQNPESCWTQSIFILPNDYESVTHIAQAESTDTLSVQSWMDAVNSYSLTKEQAQKVLDYIKEVLDENN